MILRRRLLFGVAATLTVVLRPCIAHAQLETFAQAVRDLAAASGQPEPSRSVGIHAAIDRLAPALAEWDRRIGALKAQADGELAGSPTAEHAFQRHVELGVAYRARGRMAEAIREFDAASRIRSSSDVQVLRALTFESGGRFDEAGSAFRAAWNLDPASPIKAYYAAQRGAAPGAERDRARAMLAEAYRDLGSDGVRPGSDRGQTPTPPFLTLGVIPDDLSRAPVVADNATTRGFALLREEKYSDAVAALKRAESRGKPDDSPLAHFARGQQDEAMNRVAEARSEYQAALAGTLAGRTVLFVAIGRLLQVEGDAAGAIDAFGQAVRLNPNDPTVHKELAGAYAAESRADEAFCELMAALLIDRRDAQAHASIGQLYLDTGRNADAVKAFGRALELRPDGYEVRYSLATALTRLGNAAEAARQLEIYDRARREALEKRRRDIANEVQEEERRRGR
jgi:tetratricopeptide (TPR) repeat protein